MDGERQLKDEIVDAGWMYLHEADVVSDLGPVEDAATGYFEKDKFGIQKWLIRS